MALFFRQELNNNRHATSVNNVQLFCFILKTIEMQYANYNVYQIGETNQTAVKNYFQFSENGALYKPAIFNYLYVFISLHLHFNLDLPGR